MGSYKWHPTRRRNCYCFELYLSELLKELSQQLHHEAPVQFLREVKNVYSLRNQTKVPLQSKYCRTVTKKDGKCLKESL